jgi:hypothetical protein
MARDVALKLHGNRALTLEALGRHRESVEEWTQVVELSNQPVPVGYRISLALALAQTSDLNRALDQVQLVKPPSNASGESNITGVDCYNVACLYSLSAVAVRKDDRMAPDLREKSVKAHISNALQWLTAAAKAGFFRDPGNRDHARKSDDDLKILRDLPEFHQIIESGGANP